MGYSQKTSLQRVKLVSDQFCSRFLMHPLTKWTALLKTRLFMVITKYMQHFFAIHAVFKEYSHCRRYCTSCCEWWMMWCFLSSKELHEVSSWLVEWKQEARSSRRQPQPHHWTSLMVSVCWHSLVIRQHYVCMMNCWQPQLFLLKYLWKKTFYSLHNDSGVF